MKIVVINKDYLENIPPLISVIYHLNELGHHVQVITTGYKETTGKYFKDNNIDAHVIQLGDSSSKLDKLMGYIKYRRAVSKLLPELDFDYLWVEGGNTILALGSVLLKYKFILQISELYEKSPRMFNAIRKVIHGASAVVLPEYNRAVMYQVWFSLRRRPYVLPNIPAFMPSEGDLKQLEKKYSDKIALLEGKTVVLYQGHIGPGRDLTNVAKAIDELGEQYILLLMGKDHNTVAKLKGVCNHIVHIDFIPAPEYLAITKNATMGILSYDPTSINNAYCAPNKLFEYAAYGLPMLGNDIPGLKYMLEYYHAGEIMDETSISSIKGAIRQIEGNLNNYRSNSRKLFAAYNNKETVSKILYGINEA